MSGFKFTAPDKYGLERFKVELLQGSRVMETLLVDVSEKMENIILINCFCHFYNTTAAIVLFKNRVKCYYIVGLNQKTVFRTNI